MAENRYNVDDILQEVRAKRVKSEQTTDTIPEKKISAADSSVEELLASLNKTRRPQEASQEKPFIQPERTERRRPKYTATFPDEAEPLEQPKRSLEMEPALGNPVAKKAVEPPRPAPKASEPVRTSPAMQSTEPEIQWDSPATFAPSAAAALTAVAADINTKQPAARRKAGATQWNVAATRRTFEPIIEELEHRRKGLTISLIFHVLMLLGVLYLALAPVYHLMLPGFLATSGAMRVWGMVALVVISAIACGGTLGNGLISIFTARRSNDAYVTLTVFACLLQGSFMAARADLLESFSANLYLPLAAGILLFNTAGKLVENSRRFANCEMISQQPPVECRVVEKESRIANWAAELPEEAETVLCMNPAASAANLENELELSGHTEALAGVVAPITAGAALIMAVVAYFLKGDLYTSACIFTAALCITSPFAASLGSHLPLSRTNAGLQKAKAALLGEDTVERLAESDAVLLRCAELFPSGSITLHGIKTFDNKPIDTAIIHAASVLCSVDNTLTGVFRGMIGSGEMLKPVENIVSEEGLGLSAWVEGGRVLIGNRGLLEAHGVAVPPIELEQKMKMDGREILYLSNFGSLTAGFIISYRADRQVSRLLKSMERRGMALLVHSTDPNVTPELVAQVYNIPQECIHLLPASLHQEAEEALCGCETTPAGMVSSGFVGNLRCLLAAQRCMGTSRAISVMLLVEVLLGFALITFLAYSGAMARLTWQAIGVYQLFWLFIISLVGVARK